MDENLKIVHTMQQHAVLDLDISLEVKEKEEEEEEEMNLRILSPGVSHHRRILEKTDFNIKRALPLPGEHVLTVLENALVKIDLVSALPWLCSSLVEGNPQLEYILGPKCIRALVHLMTAQMAWREAKSGRKIPSGRSSSSSSSPTILRFHVMDENVNNKLDGGGEGGGGRGEDEMKPSREIRDKRDKNFVPTFGISTIKSDEEEEEQQQPAEGTVTTTTKTAKAVDTSSFVMMIKEKGKENMMLVVDDKKKKKKQEQEKKLTKNDDEKMTVSKRRRRRHGRHDRAISILENDQSKITFLWNLIRNGSDVLPPPPPPHHQSDDEPAAVNLQEEEEENMMMREQVDALGHKKEKEARKNKTNKDMKRPHHHHKGQNIVKLIRAALHSKYEDHVRKALKEKDSKALLCMLSLVGADDDDRRSHDTTNLLRRQSSSSSSSSPPQSPKETKKDKIHKPTCRKQVVRPKSRISPSPPPPPQEGPEETETKTTPLLPSFQKDAQVTGVVVVEDSTDQIEKSSTKLFSQEDDVVQDEKVTAVVSASSSSSTSEFGLTNLFSTSDLHLSSKSSKSGETSSSSRRESSSSQLEEEEEEEDNERENDGQEAEIEVTETSLSRTQQVLRIPYYYSRSKSNPSTSSSSSSSYDDDTDAYDVQIVQSTESLRIHQNPKSESDKEQDADDDERQGETNSNSVVPKDKDDDEANETPIEQGRKGTPRESQAESPQNSLKNGQDDDELMHSPNENGGNLNKNSEKDNMSSEDAQEYWENEVRRAYKDACNLLSLNFLAVKKIMDIHKTLETPTCTPAFRSFRLLFTALQELMADRLATSLEEHCAREHRLRESWTNERRCLAQLDNLQAELKDLEEFHGPQMLTLDFQTRILNRRLRQVSNDNYQDIRQVIRETQLNSAIAEKREMVKVVKVEKALMEREENCLAVKKRHNWEETRFKQRRNDLVLKLREEIERYDEMAFKRQFKLDSVVERKIANEVLVNCTQEKFADVKDRFIDMRATKKLRQIKRNMELADDYKRARAAKMIQDFWRRYKIRKRRREKRGKKKGKKKAGGGGGGTKKSGTSGVSEGKTTGKTMGGKQTPLASNKSKTRA